MGLARICLVTPHTRDVKNRIRASWGEAGLPCAAERHLGLSHHFAFAEVSDETIGALERVVAAEGCDSAAVVCTNLRDAAIADASACIEDGLDGFVVEKHGDVPFLKSVGEGKMRSPTTLEWDA